jgi:hypothetical protein
MLKLTYVESDLLMEQLQGSLEAFIQCRVMLAVRLSQTLQIEPSHAAFLLPADLPELSAVETIIRTEPVEAIAIEPIDDDYVEVSLRGIWIANDTQAHEGIFVCAIAPQTEGLIYRLWQAQTKVSFLS